MSESELLELMEDYIEQGTVGQLGRWLCKKADWCCTEIVDMEDSEVVNMLLYNNVRAIA